MLYDSLLAFPLDDYIGRYVDKATLSLVHLLNTDSQGMWKLLSETTEELLSHDLCDDEILRLVGRHALRVVPGSLRKPADQLLDEHSYPVTLDR